MYSQILVSLLVALALYQLAYIQYSDIKDLDKNKLVLMHFDKVELYEQVKKDGFQVGHVVGDIDE